MSNAVKPNLDAFTAKVVSDPAKPQGTTLLQGFLGAASQPDHTRVYSDLTLENYLDVANSDIVHTEPMTKDQSPMGGSYLWVKKDAALLSSDSKAKFLQGPITAEGAVAQPQLQGWYPHTQAVAVCYPHHTYHPPYACVLPQIVNQPQAGIAQPQLQVPITSPVVTCHHTLFAPLCQPTYNPMTCAPTYLVGCIPHTGTQRFAAADQAAGAPVTVPARAPGPPPPAQPTTTIFEVQTLHPAVCQVTQIAWPQTFYPRCGF